MQSVFANLSPDTRQTLFEQWMTQPLADAALRDDLLSNDELRAQSAEFLSSLLRHLGTGASSDSTSFAAAREQLERISSERARQGYSPRETAQYILSLKPVLEQHLLDQLRDEPQRQLDALRAVNRAVDELGMHATETYLRDREEVIRRQGNEINEISTPVIKVWDGIVALPIIGTLDSMRTQVVMENLLQQIVDTGSTIAILDISGVPTVDSLVAQHLIKTVSATRLMGAECIISGIRPEIAQTIVHLGIDLSRVQTKATLASALKLAYRMLGLEVRATLGSGGLSF